LPVYVQSTDNQQYHSNTNLHGTTQSLWWPYESRQPKTSCVASQLKNFDRGRYRCTFQLLGKRRRFQQKDTFGKALRNSNNKNQIWMNIRSWKPILTAVGIRCADHVTPSILKKLALTSPTSGGRPVGIVRVWTKSHGVQFSF
jgi:hypothetical protein